MHARHLHTQEIAAAAEVTDREPLDQILAVFVDERFERHEVERAIRRDEHSPDVTVGGAQGPHQQIVDRARMCFHVGPRPIAHRLPQRFDRLVDSCAGPRSTPGAPFFRTT